MPNMEQRIVFRTYGDNTRALSNVRACIEPVQPYELNMALPATPVIHPYHPNYNDNNYGVPKFPVVINLPDACIPAISEQLGVANIECFITMQSNPWQNIPLLLRPHPWVHRDAPGAGNYNNATNTEIWLATGGQFRSYGSQNVFTHGPGTIVFSPDNMHIPTEVCNYQRTNVFFSAVIDRQNNRAAITLHVLLNEQDFGLVQNNVVNELRGASLTLENLLDEIANNGVNIREVTYFANGAIPIFNVASVNLNPVQPAGQEELLVIQRSREEQEANLAHEMLAREVAARAEAERLRQQEESQRQQAADAVIHNAAMRLCEAHPTVDYNSAIAVIKYL